MCAYVHVEPWQLWLCCEVSFGFKPHKSHLSAVVNMSYSHTHTHTRVFVGIWAANNALCSSYCRRRCLLGLDLVSRHWATAASAATCSFVFHLALAIAARLQPGTRIHLDSHTHTHTHPTFFICFPSQ